jgi:AcrR family transcriptional regulator
MRLSVQRAAAEAFLENGYADTSIQDIADRVGIPKGSAYHYVQSKEQLLFEVLMSGIEGLVSDLQTIASYPLAASDRLRLAIWSSLKSSFDDSQPAISVALQPDFRFLTPEHLGAYISSRDQYQEVFNRLLSEGSERGEFRHLENPKMVVFAILGMLANVRRWYQPEGPLSLEDIAGIWWDLVFNGLQPSPE